MESETIQETRDWLNSQENGIYSNSHKAAKIRSCEPFGLFATYIDKAGVEYFYINGKIDSVEYDGKIVHY